MKFTAKLLLIFVLLVCLASSTLAGKKDRKLTISAYLSSAKIEIISGDLERYETAVAYLDSLFMHYGPHAEGLKLMAQVQVDLLEKKAVSPEEKLVYVEKLVAYVDSLHMCCENDQIKKKHRKDCDKHVEFTDSLKVQYWTIFYNKGVQELLPQVENYQSEIDAAPDSSYRADYEQRRKATLDTLVTTMKMAALLNPQDHRSYVGISTAYEKAGEFRKAIEWLGEAVKYVGDEEKPNLILRQAFDAIQLADFNGAIPYFKAYTELLPTDIVNMGNLAICYNNCGFYDSAAAVNQKILEIDPINRDALIGMGRYYNQLAREATDSSTAYRRVENEEAATAWTERRDAQFDSSMTYFKTAAENYPDDIESLEQYATITGLKSLNAEAAAAFRKLADLETSSAEYSRAAGDFYLRDQKFDEAIIEYERTVERDPGDAETWQRLADLYDNAGDTEKAAAAKKKIEELK
ncbi:MAG: tetratricopeptide repeat protein [Candidatus Zixiibacteriota bacterium]|nr:MAG: tetratricopeptide repeat protein [candidate division Zixibacteria bacterium]